MKNSKPIGGLIYNSLNKILLIMRISSLLLIFGILQLQATEIYSQKTRISLEVKETKLNVVLDRIEKESEFYFLYNEKLFDTDRIVSIKAKDELVSVILDGLFHGTDVKYTIIDRKIILAPGYLTRGLENVKNAQQQRVTGIVTDAVSGEPVIGANIIIEGTTIGVITDTDGQFIIDVPGVNSTLLVSFIGYISEKVSLNGQPKVHIKLVPDIKNLEEVVVVGYGVEKKKLTTGATSQVKAEDIEKVHATRLEQVLQGRTPGVTATTVSGQPGEGMKIFIRGMGTIGNHNPLFIVDGVPTSDINYLNPSDIATIDVLKDGASSAIYGSRAANGVVLITTKKGEKGKMQVSLDTYYGIQNMAKKLPMLTAEQYASIINEASYNSGAPLPFSAGQVANMGKGTDWQNEMLNKNAPVHNYSLSATGGTDRVSYSTAVSYFSQEGIISVNDNSKFDRISARINTEAKPFDFIKTGENLTFTHTNKKGITTNDIYNNYVRNVINTSPVFPVRDSNGLYSKSYWTDEANPIAYMEVANQNKYMTDKLVGNMFIEIQPVKNLVFRSDYGIDLSFSNNNMFMPVYDLSSKVQNTTNSATMQSFRWFNWNFENTVSYQTNIGRHSLKGLAGITSFEQNYTSLHVNRTNIIGYNDLEHAIIDNATGVPSVWGGRSREALFSYFGRLNYNYAEKYMLMASLRRDGSSKFGPNNKYAVFPSIAAGWVVSQEEFMKHVNSVQSLKIRASFGVNGNQSISSSQYAFLVNKDRNMMYFFGTDRDGVQYIGQSPTVLSNPNVKWESSQQTNIGFDLRVLNSLDLTFDWYKKTTKDWLVKAPIMSTAGLDAPAQNKGSVDNTGFEISLGYSKSAGEFNFHVNTSMAVNKNKVTAISEESTFIEGSSGVLYNGIDPMNRVQVGYPIGYFYGYKTAGIFQNQEEIENYSKLNTSTNQMVKIQGNAMPGDIKFVDLNDDGVISSNDKTYLGDAFPKIVLGFNFNADYKGFDLAVSLAGSFGHKIAFAGGREFNNPYSNYTTAILDRWTGEGTSNKIPRVTLGSEANKNYQRFSDLLLHDGSFVRVKTINLGYTLNKFALRNLSIQQLRVFVSADNVFTFTKYPGYDPEVGYGSQSWDQGIDVGAYPRARTLSLGLSVKF
jgi:TonB-linked SusC/RagA family outer membrane protein